MAFYQSVLLTICLVYVHCDTSLVSSPSAPVFSSSQSLDTSGYYNTDPYAGYDYDGGYSVGIDGEEDRQDVALLGGLSLGVIGTVFFAALLGALVAPALSAGVTRIMDLEIELPEIQLPELVRKVEEEEDEDNEIVDVRSMKQEFPWVKMAEKAFDLISSELSRQKRGTKFDKFESSKKF